MSWKFISQNMIWRDLIYTHEIWLIITWLPIYSPLVRSSFGLSFVKTTTVKVQKLVLYQINVSPVYKIFTSHNPLPLFIGPYSLFIDFTTLVCLTSHVFIVQFFSLNFYISFYVFFLSKKIEFCITAVVCSYYFSNVTVNIND